MVKVYARENGGKIWTPLEGDISRCLDDPLRQGMYFLPKNGEVNLEEAAFSHSDERHPPLSNKWIHFASNLGFSTDYSCTSRIVSPDGREAYIIIQLSDDYIIDHIKRGDKVKTSFLVPNMLKLMDSGYYFIFDAPYEEVRKAIKARGYKFVEPQQGEFPTKWFYRLKDEILKQRKRLVTDEFVKKVNREYFELCPITREGLLKLLTHVDIQK